MTQDAHIQERVDELVNKAKIALDAIRALSVTKIADPLTDAAALTQAVETIILDAPQLRNNPYGCGEITTRIDKRSTCVAVNAYNGNILSEATRLESIGLRSLSVERVETNELWPKTMVSLRYTQYKRQAQPAFSVIVA